jgi:glucosylceramidase
LFNKPVGEETNVGKATRRHFLKLSGIAGTALATGTSLKTSALTELDAGRAAASPPGSVSVWITDDTRRLAKQPSLNWQPASAAASDGSTILLYPNQQFQEILGFGAALTDAACYTFNRLEPAARKELFHQLFAPSEMGFNVCRACIGASDYSTKLYSYDEGASDPELQRFSIDHDRTYILPILRQAREANPDLFLFSSPWSPPGWMKPNGSMLGGNMQRRYMKPYANYFAKFLQAYAAENVPVQAVTVQNEVDTDQDGRMPACTWPQEYEADFVRGFLGPAFQQNKIQTKIWIIDHNYNLWGRAIAELETPGVSDFTNAIAWHGYVGKSEWIDRVHQAFPNVEMYWTEGGPDYRDPNYAKNWATWSATFTEVLRHWCRSITAWNFALDEIGHPNIGPFFCGGLLTIDSKTNAISYSGQYHAFAHYSRFIRRGAHRFESQNADTGLAQVAFENPDGTHVLVVTNPQDAKSCEVRWEGQAVTLDLSPNSVATLVW